MKKVICSDTKEEFTNYKEYLKSNHWKNVKDRMYKSKYKYTCYCCGKKYGLQLHHKSYKRIGKEKLNDLIYLCGDCHSKVHKYIDNSNCDSRRKNSKLWSAARITKKKIKK